MKPAQLDERPECVICADPRREAADMLLLRGKSFETIQVQLGWPREFRAHLRAHLFDKHVGEPTKECYTIMLVDYAQEANKLLERELQRNHKDQRTQIISLGFKAREWWIAQYARMGGFWVNKGKQIDGNVIDALNALAQGDPGAVKRIAEARQKQKPVLIESKTVETPVKDPFEVE